MKNFINLIKVKLFGNRQEIPKYSEDREAAVIIDNDEAIYIIGTVKGMQKLAETIDSIIRQYEANNNNKMFKLKEYDIFTTVSPGG